LLQRAEYKISFFNTQHLAIPETGLLHPFPGDLFFIISTVQQLNSSTSKQQKAMKRILIILICASSGILHAQQNSAEEMRKHIRYAQTAYSAGEFNDALKEYKTAQTFAPDYPELYKAIGDVYEKLGGSTNLMEAIFRC
jgi:tetratricopeptide (TPR) repeat protein